MQISRANILFKKTSESFILRILRILYPMLFFSFLLLSCKQSQISEGTLNPDSRLKVLFFHTSFRCPTCNAIEDNTKKVLYDNFKAQIDSGIISFASFTIDNPENKALIEIYQISYTNLLLIKADTTKTDFTYTAFEYAYVQPEKYAELLKAALDKNLK